MAYYLVGTILFACYNLEAYSFPRQRVIENNQESLEDIMKDGADIAGIGKEGESVKTDDNEILKIIKDFVGNSDDVKRTLFYCKDGSCKIINADDLNVSANKTKGIINVQRKKLTKNISKEKIKAIYDAKDSIPSIEATYDRASKQEGLEPNVIENNNIKSMPKLKLQHVYKGNKYLRIEMNTDPFVVTVTTPELPKIEKFRFVKTKVPYTTTSKPRIYYIQNKIPVPEALDEVIKQYQMYPGAGCVYVKGCDGIPKKLWTSPKVMALIAKIYRELPDKPEESQHSVMSFYLQKYDPQRVYVEDDEYHTTKRRTTLTTTKKEITECFLY